MSYHSAKEVEEIIRRFRYKMLLNIPFYGPLLSRIEIVSDKGIFTAATDGIKIMYNPKFLMNLTMGQIHFVILHELMHIILQHPFRGKDKFHPIANIAMDAIVNDFLYYKFGRIMKDAKIEWERPNEGVFETVKVSDTFESLYKEKMLKYESDKKTFSDTLKKAELFDVIFSEDEVEEIDGLEINENGLFVKRIIADALKDMKGRSMSGSIPLPTELYKIYDKKALNWKRLLKDFLTEQIEEDTSYITPERKYIHMDLIIPGHGLTEGEPGEIWAFVDSSGSISNNEMSSFLKQLYAITAQFDCKLHIAYWDTSVTDVYHIKREKDLPAALPKHFGGTDINCIYDWIADNKVKPDIMLIFTDGFFGNLNTYKYNQKLKAKTILVLSKWNNIYSDNFKKIGKIVELEN